MMLVITTSLILKKSWNDFLCCQLLLKMFLELLLDCCTFLLTQEICQLVGQLQDGMEVNGVMLED